MGLDKEAEFEGITTIVCRKELEPGSLTSEAMEAAVFDLRVYDELRNQLRAAGWIDKKGRKIIPHKNPEGWCRSMGGKHYIEWSASLITHSPSEQIYRNGETVFHFE